MYECSFCQQNLFVGGIRELVRVGLATGVINSHYVILIKILKVYI